MYLHTTGAEWSVFWHLLDESVIFSQKHPPLLIMVMTWHTMGTCVCTDKLLSGARRTSTLSQNVRHIGGFVYGQPSEYRAVQRLESSFQNLAFFFSTSVLRTHDSNCCSSIAGCTCCSSLYKYKRASRLFLRTLWAPADAGSNECRIYSTNFKHELHGCPYCS